MLLRGATIRRLCSLPVRPYSTAIDVSSAARAAPASVSESEASTEGDMKDVTRYMSVREANKSRTRARVGGRLKAFLGSSEPHIAACLVPGIMMLHVLQVRGCGLEAPHVMPTGY